jgi:hypothetical protein
LGLSGNGHDLLPSAWFYLEVGQDPHDLVEVGAHSAVHEPTDALLAQPRRVGKLVCRASVIIE